MSVEVETVFRLWCDDCRKWLRDSNYPFIQHNDFHHEDTLYAEARKQGWTFDQNTASWYCPDCQKGN